MHSVGLAYSIDRQSMYKERRRQRERKGDRADGERRRLVAGLIDDSELKF